MSASRNLVNHHRAMRIAILSFEVFNELDSFIARVAGWKAAKAVVHYVAPEAAAA